MQDNKNMVFLSLLNDFIYSFNNEEIIKDVVDGLKSLRSFYVQNEVFNLQEISEYVYRLIQNCVMKEWRHDDKKDESVVLIALQNLEAQLHENSRYFYAVLEPLVGEFVLAHGCDELAANVVESLLQAKEAYYRDLSIKRFLSELNQIKIQENAQISLRNEKELNLIQDKRYRIILFLQKIYESLDGAAQEERNDWAILGSSAVQSASSGGFDHEMIGSLGEGAISNIQGIRKGMRFFKTRQFYDANISWSFRSEHLNVGYEEDVNVRDERFDSEGDFEILLDGIIKRFENVQSTCGFVEKLRELKRNYHHDNGDVLMRLDALIDALQSDINDLNIAFEAKKCAVLKSLHALMEAMNASFQIKPREFFKRQVDEVIEKYSLTGCAVEVVLFLQEIKLDYSDDDLDPRVFLDQISRMSEAFVMHMNESEEDNREAKWLLDDLQKLIKSCATYFGMYSELIHQFMEEFKYSREAANIVESLRNVEAQYQDDGDMLVLLKQIETLNLRAVEDFVGLENPDKRVHELCRLLDSLEKLRDNVNVSWEVVPAYDTLKCMLANFIQVFGGETFARGAIEVLIKAERTASKLEEAILECIDEVLMNIRKDAVKIKNKDKLEEMFHSLQDIKNAAQIIKQDKDFTHSDVGSETLRIEEFHNTSCDEMVDDAQNVEGRDVAFIMNRLRHEQKNIFSTNLGVKNKIEHVVQQLEGADLGEVEVLKKSLIELKEIERQCEEDIESFVFKSS